MKNPKIKYWIFYNRENIMSNFLQQNVPKNKNNKRAIDYL